MDKIQHFVSQVFYHHPAFSVSVVLVIMLWLVKKFWLRGLNNKTFKVLSTSLLATGFFWSSFLTWKHEYEKTHPGLSLSLDEAGFLEGVTINDGPKRFYFPSAAYLVASVRNLGPQSGATHYELRVIIPGQKEPIKPPLLVFSDMPDDVVLPMNGDNIPIGKLLYKQTESLIATGDERQGFLIFSIPGDQKSLQYLNQDGTTFVLTCKDVHGNVITGKGKLKGINEGHRRYVRLQ